MPNVFYPIGRWSEVKLVCLDKYLSAYLTVIMKKFPNAKRFYVDLFAGPGCDEIRSIHKKIDGSPLRAMNQKRGSFTDYIFVENRSDYFDSLSEQVRAHPRGQHVQLMKGDCNSLVSQVVGKIPQDSLTFLFVDPQGLDVKWTTIERFSAHRHLDMLLTFPYDFGIKRCAYDRKSFSKVDEFYGTRDWREIAEQRGAGLLSPMKARDAFARLYVSQLTRTNLAYSEATLLRTSIVTGRPLYHMIFASRYYVALDIWRSVASRHVGTLDRFLRH